MSLTIYTEGLTDDQTKAFNALLDWYENTDEPFFTLDGAAGTGKTYTAKSFTQFLLDRKVAVVVSAPTHKAKKVISDRTDITGMTIQTLLGLRPNTDLDNFNVNRPQFDPLSFPKIKEYKLILIDECSMIGKGIFGYLKKQCEKHNTRLLFLGDSKQLPPIKEKLSKTFEVESSYTLTDIIRQSNDNPLMEILGLLRDDLDNKTNEGRYFIAQGTADRIVGDKGYAIIDSHKEFVKAATPYFAHAHAVRNFNHVRYLAWTNASVEGFNKIIKGEIAKANNIPDYEFNKGDMLTAYATPMLSDGVTPRFMNTEDYVIYSVEEDISEDGIEGYKVCLINSSNEMIYVHFVSKESRNVFYKRHRELLADAKEKKGRAWKTYYEFRSRNIIPYDITIEGQKRVIKYIDFGYGITVHKSQGSTYNTVFINFQDIIRNRKVEEVNKLLYVALSRASNKTYILI